MAALAIIDAQALRDRLPIDEAAQLATQLPESIREIDYDVRAVLPEEPRAILS